VLASLRGPRSRRRRRAAAVRACDRPGRGGEHVPTLCNFDRTLGRLLVTGKGTGDDECDQNVFLGLDQDGRARTFEIFSGFSHADLNKDWRAAGVERCR
jgi:hypothetical protein